MNDVPEIDDRPYLVEMMTTSTAGKENAALLCWHRLYDWPALRDMDREWPMLRLVP